MVPDMQPYSVRPFAVLQTISEVLTDCGSDIDAAIKRLGQLQLRTEGRSDPAAAEQANGSAAAAAAAASPRGSPLGENLFLTSPWDEMCRGASAVGVMRAPSTP